MNRQIPLFLPCAGGVEPLLAAEVAAILARKTGAKGITEARGGVQLLASPLEAMRLNLESRLAQRVLWQLAEGPYRHEDDLYELARTVDWREWITPRQTLRVDTTARQKIGRASCRERV